MTYFIAYLLIPSVFLMSRKSLHEVKSFLIILSLCTILSVYGVANMMIDHDYKYLDFLCPLYSLIIYRILLFIFYSITKKYPDIPSRSFPAGDEEIANRIFFIVFIFFGLIVPNQLAMNFA